MNKGITIYSTPLLLASLTLVALGSFGYVEQDVISMAKNAALIILSIAIGTMVISLGLFTLFTKSKLKINKSESSTPPPPPKPARRIWAPLYLLLEVSFIVAISASPNMKPYLAIAILLMVKWTLSLIHIQKYKLLKEKVNSQIKAQNL